MGGPELPEQGAAPAEPAVIFRVYEKLETCEAIQVTRENMLDIAEHFGWSVEMKDLGGKKKPVLRAGSKEYDPTFEIGDWITRRGSSRPGFRGQWRPEGYYSAGRD